MAQTSYSDKPAIAFAGMLADIGPKYSSTGVNEEAVAIPFGLGLIVWIPVMLLTIYTSYRDVFVSSAAAGQATA